MERGVMEQTKRKPELSRKKALDALLLSGAMMANLCYNLSQQKAEYQGSFKESYLSWDKAMRVYRECIEQAKKARRK